MESRLETTAGSVATGSGMAVGAASAEPGEVSGMAIPVRVGSAMATVAVGWGAWVAGGAVVADGLPQAMMIVDSRAASPINRTAPLVVPGVELCIKTSPCEIWAARGEE